jgi:hypothetical protein
MCYAPLNGIHRTFPQYEKYNIPIIRKKDIPENSLIVLPEILPHLSNEFSQKKALWWLSVDNFLKENDNLLDNFSLHLTQSEYARQYLNGLNINSVMLTDYINDVFVEKIISEKIEKVCVNPSKGNHLIQEFKLKNKHLNILELSHMSRETVKEHLNQSMIYVDFGHHPR